ncbi:MAG TPA: DciA family protein [Candidatus Competibacter sp.]|nr:DciA family protein [Candidatus Competibacter sp.]
MAESDDIRARARQHTAQLLKMLRGYGPATDPGSATASGAAAAGNEPAAVAEATTAYVRRLNLASGQRRAAAAVAAEAQPTPTPTPTPTQALAVEHVQPLDVAAEAQPTPTPRKRPRQNPIAPVGQILCRQQGVLGELMVQANRLIRLSQIFHAYLPPHLCDHAVLIRLDQDSWIVHADSASWATRLRYALHNIRDVLGQQLGFALPKPRVRVVPVEPPPSPRRPRLTLTARNAKLLEATARNLSDERLSTALRQLAKHGNPARKSTENGRR